MTEKESFNKRERWMEETYFRKQEEELIKNLRRRRELKEVTGVADEGILKDLEELGYTGKITENLLYLVPLVQVAWAEDFVTERERRCVFQAARRHGVVEGAPAYRRLVAWLDQRPSDEFFEKNLRIIRYLLGLLPPEERDHRKHNLMASCMLVASASGSILEVWDLVSDAECAVLRRIASELESEQKPDHDIGQDVSDIA